MQFTMLIYHGPAPTLPGTDRWKALPEAEQKKIYADYAELNKTTGATSGPPLGLPATARTVKMHDGKVQVDEGTYQPEGLAGYLQFEAGSIDEAIALAQKVPAVRLGGAVEIRPSEKYW